MDNNIDFTKSAYIYEVNAAMVQPPHLKPEVQCTRCKHNLQLQSCGACVMQTMKKMQLLENSVETVESITESYKNTCKVVMESPGDYNQVNPVKCKYFFPLALKLF